MASLRLSIARRILFDIEPKRPARQRKVLKVGIRLLSHFEAELS